MSNKIYIMQTITNGSGVDASGISTQDVRLQGRNVERVLIDLYEKIANRNIEDKEEISLIVRDGLNDELTDLQEEVSKLQITKDKIDLLVKSKDSNSELTLTDRMLELISQNIKITADRIDLCGYISNGQTFDDDGNVINTNGNWHVTKDGQSEFSSLHATEISCDRLTVNDINSGKYRPVLTGSMTLNVDSVNGSDDVSLVDGATFKSFAAINDKIPTDLNGATVTINLINDISEYVTLSHFENGTIDINLNGYTLKGYVYAYMFTAVLRIHDGCLAPGYLFPYNGNNSAILLRYMSYAYIERVKIYGFSSDANSVCIYVTDFSNCALQDVTFADSQTGCKTGLLSRVFCHSSLGKVNSYGWVSEDGGSIILGKEKQQATGDNGLGSGDDITNEGTTPDNTTPNSGDDKNPEVEVKDPEDDIDQPEIIKYSQATYSSTGSHTYYSDKSMWRSTAVCCQGDYGYGNCNGIWIFGSQFNNLKGKSVQSVKLTITRTSGGIHSPRNLVIKMHNHSSKPSGKPSYLSTWSKTFLLGETTGSITITDQEVLTAIQNGTMKGFGLQSTYNSTNYAVCTSCKAEVTYR